MRLSAIFLVAFLSTGGSASALDTLTGNTVYMAIQCDIGRFAAITEEMGLDPAMKAAVEISWSIEDSTGGKMTFGLQGLLRKGIFFGPSGKSAVSVKRIGRYAIKTSFNVHEGNTAACGPKGQPRTWVGVFECLSGNTDPLKHGSTASCSMSRDFEGTLDADLQFMLVDVQGDHNAKATYLIKVDVPMEEKTKVALVRPR
jgi:hypothetical protein